jgi:hypothetical protein
MADAIAVNAINIPLSGLDLAAGYDTGTPGIKWTAADWARFTGITQVHIDQGYQSPPVTTSTVRDVEPGAWGVAAAVDLSTWATARPTIYCDQYDLTRPGGVLASGWHGDLWLAIPGWQPGQPLPATPGCTVVAVQNALGDAHGTYDLSIVIDPAWPALPEGDSMPIAIGATGVTEIYLLDGGKMSHIPDPASLLALTAAGVKQVTVSPAALTQFLADFPPGQPSGVPPSAGASGQGTFTWAATPS